MIVVCPIPTPVAGPDPLIGGTVESLDSHVTFESTRVLPSEDNPGAVNCLVASCGIVGCAGVP